ncbi:MAG TPA: hypothetical protein PKC76_02695 [Saprospiraceae bacterium]|nr:hypothetical protein [Saprospiraceae bacterium]HMP23009.1 hypothetical protein [Saprospiraceae bacterium]
MQKTIIILLMILFLYYLNVFGQKRLNNLRNNANFAWVVDSIETNVMVYYEMNSYAEKHKTILKERIQYHIKSTSDFMGLEAYNKPIHYFIVENRSRMKLLVGYETNGLANFKNHLVAAIFSEKINAVTNHELFHLMAANSWGYPETWINEGMAVYADAQWYGYHLHELSKYLIDNDTFISLDNMAKKLRKYDAMLTYPLLGSFAKFIDETYGRATIQLIWLKGRKQMKKHIGKHLDELEREWLEMLQSVKYKDIHY